jgi:hypothetical protein
MTDSFLVPSEVQEFICPQTYSDLGLSIEIVPNSYQSTWYKAGYLQILLPFNNKWIAVSTDSILLTWQQIIHVPYANYRLRFSLSNWLDGCKIDINPYSIQYNPMGINYQNVDKVTGPIVNTTVAALVTSVQLLAADPLRHEGTIYNKTNKTIYLSWGATAATTADLAIPVGANADIPEDYTGAVQVIGAAGVTGNVLAQTISFI